MVSDKKSAANFNEDLLYMMSYFFFVVSEISLSFNNLIMIYLGVDV